MRDRNGRDILPHQRVIIADKIVKECNLPSNEGFVKQANYNREQLVGVTVDGEEGTWDFHAKSLVIKWPLK